MTSAQTPKELKLGIVGFGKLGLLHSALANGLPGCRLAAVADQSSAMLSMLRAQMPNVQMFSNHQDMMNRTQLDGVFIATPTHLHVPIAVDFVKAGVPVFVEKPLSLTAQQAEPLRAALRERPVANMVGYMSRFTDTFAQAKKIVDSGALGKLQLLRCTMYITQLMKPGKGWRYEKGTSGGGVLITQNSHLIDMLLWVFGDIKEVSGHTSHLYSSSVEDAAHVFMRFENGLTGWMDSSWSVRHHRTLTMQIHVQGENGTLDFNDDEVRLFLDRPASTYSAAWNVWKKPDLFRGVSIDVGGPHYTRQAEDFVDAILGQNKIHSTVESAYKVQKVIDAIYQSAESQGMPKPVSRS